MTYQIDYCKSELTLNLCRSSTSELELLSTSNRDRGKERSEMINELSLSRG